ncbi:hypothetical protein WICPIJ_009340 [Wickerhamomyces pijperi]|uniref:Origin recognition complex subunit 3 n=1 Tax=Wickerhamomyces pijperi TaxID=599730 RepID=A0A9P8TDL4_WICPI|nr:hypothetical protein WICPIJ_009340 [Wickerhamomyces pijperi]
MDEHEYINSQKTVYVLKPRTKRKLNHDQRPHTVNQEGQPLPKKSKNPMVGLLGGKEPISFANLRYENYRKSIKKQEEVFESLYQNLDVDLLKKIVEVARSDDENDYFGSRTIKTIALFNKSSVGNGDSFIHKLLAELESKRHTIVTLNSKEANTMRNALKTIIHGVTKNQSASDRQGHQNHNNAAEDEEDEDGQLLFDKRSPYDFDIIREWCLKNYHRKNKIMVVFEDIDSFNPHLLGKLIKMMHSQNEKVPFRLIFNSTVNFTTLVRNIDVQVQNMLTFSSFEVDQVNYLINLIVKNLIMNNDFLIGEDLSQLITQKFHNSVKNIDMFDKILKLSTMAFYFNNPFSIFYYGDKEIPKEYIPHLRQLKSFQRHIEGLVGRSHYERAQILLTNDEKLRYFFIQELSSFKNNELNFKSLFRFVTEVLSGFTNSINSKAYNYLDIYHILILSDKDHDLLKTKFFVDILNDLKGLGFYDLKQLITLLSQFQDPSVRKLYTDNEASLDFSYLEELNDIQSRESQLQFKLEFSRFKDTFIKLIDQFLKTSMKPFANIPFNELFLISNSQDIIQKNLFPEYRENIINSLINHESLLSVFENATSPLQKFNELNELINPLIVELFQIYRDTNLILNIYDFYQVFKYSMNYDKIIDTFVEVLDDDTFNVLENYLNDEDRFKFIYQFFNDPDVSKEEKYDKLMLVFFLQKCNEMIYMGFFKERKPKDYLEKAVWRGL